MAEQRPNMWTCGHVAKAVCAECHHKLVQTANELAQENMLLRGRIEHLEEDRAEDRQTLKTLKDILAKSN